MAALGQDSPISDEEAVYLLHPDEEEAPPPYTRHSTEDILRTRAQLDINAEQESLRKEKTIKWRLYISHSLSTWNSRVFEFACLLFIGHLWEDTLLPVSIYALVRSASAICLAPMVGWYVDRGDRLRTVRLSIVGQRVAVLLWIGGFMFAEYMTWGQDKDKVLSLGTLFLLIPFGCVEKLCSIMNLVAIERDWVVVTAESTLCGLDVLNSQMRRIDLACKLLGPLFIALVDGYKYDLAIVLIFSMNVSSILIEYFAIADVYRRVPALRTGRPTVLDPPDGSPPEQNNSFRQPFVHFHAQIRFFFKSLHAYSQHTVFFPSLALSLLYLTVLSFSGQMIIYLLSIKGPKDIQLAFPTTSIGLLRTLSVTFEMLATWLAPAIMKRVGPTRAGLWAISWQLTFSWIAVSLNWYFQPSYISAWVLVSGVILSRVGLWSFDLCVQIIVQEGVDPTTRGSFSALEASLQNFFELLAYISTIIFPRPSDFQYPAFMSAAAVLVACILYAEYVRRTRGHLIHLSRCWDGKKDEGQRRRSQGQAIRLRELA
ncbi:hypothetical protein N7G274_008604 [Stereocaulon virgatum]|uniref:Solute carrier family 40 member n=1 Tax=Stereocaulon virgatum TaxID=373712 RepID=A0ABR3ZXZ9_9LECA